MWCKLCQTLWRSVTGSNLRASLACLCCLSLVSIPVLYVCYDCVGNRTHAPLPGDSYTVKSWTTSVATKYGPSLPANCSSLWAGDEREVARVKSALEAWQNSRSDEAFLEQLRNCSYIQEFLSDNLYISSAEKEFPLAFLFTIHDYPQQVMRLLRVLYRPHNLYCFHVDAKAKVELIEAFRNLTMCIPNILMPRELVSVYRVYGESILEAQLSCLEMLHLAHVTWKWKYVMNLCGTELPLLTNTQMIKRLERLNGSTYIFDSDFPDKMRKSRFGSKYKINPGTGAPYKSKKGFGKPPHDMKLYKSSTYTIMSYTFTNFVLTHPKAITFRKYIEGGKNAEEQFYISLYHLPEAPIGNPPSDAHITLSASIWTYKSVSGKAKCNARENHGVCIAGVGTMKTIDHCSAFFFNKYSAKDDHVVMDCLEERIVARRKLEQVKEYTHT